MIRLLTWICLIQIFYCISHQADVLDKIQFITLKKPGQVTENPYNSYINRIYLRLYLIF